MKVFFCIFFFFSPPILNFKKILPDNIYIYILTTNNNSLMNRIRTNSCVKQFKY